MGGCMHRNNAVYAKIMCFLCNLCNIYARIIQITHKLCINYASYVTFTHKLCTNYAYYAHNYALYAIIMQ